ncbi:hypothetical protein BGZ83_002201 [Gryganskiella cystojenkinii]|nr:hypothetical protein BGZ83_002201 [Gryganskiella cystojenkinii]
MTDRNCTQRHGPREQQPLHEEQSSESVDALALPEILRSISCYLDTRSICKALPVCRHWHQVLIPLLWSNVELNLDPAQRDGPFFPELETHASWIQTLNITFRLRFDFPGGTKLSCPNLSTLRIYDRYGDRPFLNEELLRSLIQRHKSTLKAVKLHTFISEEVLDALEECPHLDHLELISRAPVNVELWMSRYDTLWSHLRLLNWMGSPPAPSSIPVGTDQQEQENTDPSTESSLSLGSLEDMCMSERKPTRIQDLQLSADWYGETLVSAQTVLIESSPQLERLRWVIHGQEHLDRRQMTRLAQICRLRNHSQQQELFRQLESLALPLMMVFSDQDFQVVLESLPMLSDLDMNWSGFDIGAWRCLQSVPRLMHQLRHLDLHSCRQVTGAVTQEILCSISSLEQFHASHVSDTDIIKDDRPWVCLEMRHLRLAFVHTEPDLRIDSEDMILKRLSTLTKLESLSLEADDLLASRPADFEVSIPRDAWKDHSLKWTLARGLDQLCTLRQLRSFKGPYPYFPKWTGQGEARWVLDHWRSMNVLLHVSLDIEAQQLLKNFAPERGWPQSHCRSE